MTIRNITQDIQKAKSLLARAQEFQKSIDSSQGEASFLLNAEYDILHALATGILAYDGEKIEGQDHHKMLIERIIKKYKEKINPAKAMLFDELRKIRNDINYYGQKDKATLIDFYERNKVSFQELRGILFTLLGNKIQKE